MAAPEIIGGRALQAAWESEAEDPVYPWDDLTESEQAYWIDWMADALGALRDAGWSLYRPDECATTKASGRRGGGRRSESRFYLVPVEGEK